MCVLLMTREEEREDGVQGKRGEGRFEVFCLLFSNLRESREKGRKEGRYNRGAGKVVEGRRKEDERPWREGMADK